MKRFLGRRLIVIAATLLALPAVTILSCDRYIEHACAERLFRTVAEVPCRQVALVLGTAKKVAGGRDNLFYMPRIEAAAELYRAGRVDGILVSGDNSRRSYDEPTGMKADLVALGVPAEHVTIDYAGFRTLDSIVRAKEVFGQDDYVVVSQPFHCRRALFLADARGHAAVAFCAADVSGPHAAKVRLREALARVKAMLDVYVAMTEPKFLGEPVVMGTR